MNREAILHIPLSQYAYAIGQHELTVRIRTARQDMRRCVLRYGDRADPHPQIRLQQLELAYLTSDDLYDYYECEIRDRYTRICYYFVMEDGEGHTLCYDERGLHAEASENRTEFFQFPYIRREDMYQIPEWAKDIVMYHIFPDSFASGEGTLCKHGRHLVVEDADSVSHLGGTLQGVMDNLEYLQNMGVNCIYLNPIFAANSYHKYDTIDYFEIDPCLGTKQEFKELVQQCHARGIRVILDGVFNHCGPDFFAFRDVLAKGSSSRYYDWFYHMPEPIEYQDPPSYEAFAYVKEMPKMNTGNPEVEDYFVKVGTYWIEEMDIDGWRLDVANEINHGFWRKFRQAVRAVKPDAFLIGEIWEDSNVWLQGDQFDSTMNYRFSYLCKDFFAKRCMRVSEFDAQINRMIMRYAAPVSQVQMNFLDSHDIPRFMTFCKSKRQMELAFFYLIMGYGVPSIFYGDECYLAGTTEPEYRQAMRWDAVSGELQTQILEKRKAQDTSAYEQASCVSRFQKWITFRKQHSAMRNGRYITVICDDERAMYAFARQNAEECVLFIINNGEQTQELSTEWWNEIENKLHGRIPEKSNQLEGLTGAGYVVSFLS